ncbi:MAG: hypothetical protein RL458_2131 [Pseudomonadota bacterium]
MGMRMDANLTLSAGSGANPLATALAIGEGAVPGSPGLNAGETMLGKEFANLMRDLLPGSERQALAADGLTASVTGLQTLTLGQQISVITSRLPQPDTPSLVAFAKMQGLDDAAVQALFGNLPHVAVGGTLQDPKQPDGAVTSDGTEGQPMLSGLDDNAKPNFVATDYSAASATPDPLIAALASGVLQKPVLPAGRGPVVSLPPVGGGGLRMIGAGPSDSPQHQTPSIDALNAILLASGVQVISSEILNGGERMISPAQLGPSDTPPLGPEPNDAVVMGLKLTWESITRNLAKTTGQDVGVPWANVVAGWVKSEDDASIGELDLQLNPTCEQGTPADAANAASASVGTDNARTSSAAHPLRPTLTLNSAPAFGPTKDRSTEISELADKLGQALSERLQEQVARGDWKLELRLKPAHLGKISVELGMNGGSLDALFKSDNALTRELLAQSAPRLRESLTHAGMAVANVWVNSNSQQQTGGNSTPRFYKPEVSEVTAPAEGAKVTTIQLARTKSKDGWDELA